MAKMKYGSGLDADPEHRLAAQIKLRAGILGAENGRLVIQGRADERFIDEGYGIEARDNDGNIWKAEYRSYPYFDFHGCDSGMVLRGFEHILILPLQNGKIYNFFLTVGKDEIRKRARCRSGTQTGCTNKAQSRHPWCRERTSCEPGKS